MRATIASLLMVFATVRDRINDWPGAPIVLAVAGGPLRSLLDFSGVPRFVPTYRSVTEAFERLDAAPGRRRCQVELPCCPRQFVFDLPELHASVDYEPAESTTGLFGGNSNRRGPVWFPIDYLLVEAIDRFAGFFGDDFAVEHPTGCGVKRTLTEVAADLNDG